MGDRSLFGCYIKGGRDEIMNGKEFIKVGNINYSIDNKRILSDAHLEVKKGQFIGLIGPNGAGKTTLIKHIYRALEPKEKCIYVDDKDVTKYSHKLLSRLISVMKQENNSDFDYSIEEMVIMARAPYRKLLEDYSKSDYEMVKSNLKVVGMDKLSHRSYRSLSGGEKQRVLIARSLTQETDILLLDEPTNHLDIYYQMSLMQLISSMKKTIISVFHELNLASKFCDYIYVIKDGEIVASGSPKKLYTKELFRDVYNMEVSITKQENGQPYVIFNEAI